MNGFQHEKIKELSGDTFAVSFVYQKKLQNIVDYKIVSMDKNEVIRAFSPV